MAIGLQKVDNLKPSKYLEKLVNDNVTGKKTIADVQNELQEYYFEKSKKEDINKGEFECDLVSTRIVELLKKDKFNLSIDYLKYVHKYLFQDVYNFAGEFRNINFSKHEKILNNDSAAYGNLKALQIELGIQNTADSFGPATQNAFQTLVRTDGICNNKFAILQEHYGKCQLNKLVIYGK